MGCIHHCTAQHIEAVKNGRHFPADILKYIFLNVNVRISIKIPQKFVPECPINNIPPLVQIRACRSRGDKPLSESMMLISPTHICVTRPQCVNAAMETIGKINDNIHLRHTAAWTQQDKAHEWYIPVYIHIYIYEDFGVRSRHYSGHGYEIHPTW